MMCLLFLVLFSPTATEPQLLHLRNLYYNAGTSKKSAEKLFETVSKADSRANPVLLAYRGIAHMFRAKHAIDPYTKLSNFNKGKGMLDKAVNASPKNLEIRFMRFSVQTNAPAFLGYNDHIAADKTTILQGYKNLSDADLKGRIKEYMLNSTHCNDHEKSIFR